MRFFDPLDVQVGQVLGRVDVACLEDTTVVVTWLGRRRGGAEFVVRLATVSGQLGPTIVIDELPAGRLTGFPRLAVSSNDIFVAWTDVEPSGSDKSDANGDKPQVRVARLVRQR